MSNLISLGSFNVNNGKSAGLGFASGLDSNALIDAILQSRTDAVAASKDTITLNGKKASAISTLSTILSTLQTTADFLRGQTGVGKEDSDFFQHTTSTLSSSTSDDASSFISVTSQAGATLSSYEITDVVTANAQIIRKDGFSSSSASVVGGAGVFTAGTFTLRGSSISIVDGDSLSRIKSKINATSATSGVIADIVQVSSSSYSLVLKASETGLENKISEYGDGDVGDPAAGKLLFGGTLIDFTSQQTPNDASFEIDGLTITRATNTIDDAITGVTFSLLADTPLVSPPTLTVDVQADVSIITNGVNNFITAYNNLKEFISQQTEKDSSGNYVDTAILGDSSLLRDVLEGVNAQFLNVVPGISSGDPKSLFDIGVDTSTFPGDDTTPKTEGILTLDTAKFTAAITSDFGAFRKVFSSSFEASSTDIGLFKTSNKATLTNYTLDIDLSRAVGDKVRVLSSTTGALLFNADYSDGLITGKAGTSLDGVQLVYTGSSVQTIDVTSTQGIADRSYNVLSNFLKVDTGLLAISTSEITDQDKTLQDNIDKENADIAIERQLLVDKFSQLESIISSANSTLSFLEAQRSSDNKG